MKSTIILLIGGILTKLLGMLIRITMSRNIGIEGISLYSLILPTFTLFISIGQIGLPITLSRLVALKNKNNKNLYFTITPIIILFNLLLSIIIILSSNFIGVTLLKNKDTPSMIRAISLVIPFTTCSSIIRSYFYGKEQMLPHSISNILENIIRWIMIILITQNKTNIKTLVFNIILSNIISEGLSSLILILFLPKTINFKNLRFQKNYLKESLTLSIPNISSNLIGNISYFLEPIIITTFLGKNTSLSLITKEYGIINGYILPLLLIPSFFSLALSQSILPNLSRLYQQNQKKKAKKLLNNTLIITILSSIIIIIIYELFGKKLLFLLYKTTIGINYLKILSPLFLFYYMEHPLSFSLQAMGKTKDLLAITIKTSFLKLSCTILLSLIIPGITPYLISIIITIIITNILLWNKINHYLK